MGLMTPAHMRGDAETSSQNQNHIHTYYLEIEQLHQIVEEQQGGKLLRHPVTSRRSVLYSPGDVLSEHEPTIHVVCTGGLVGLESKERQKTSRALRFQPLVGQHRDPHLAAVGQKKGGQSERLLTVRELLKGQGFHRACHAGERTGVPNCPRALCPSGGEFFRSSGRFIPLAGLAAPRPLTVI